MSKDTINVLQYNIYKARNNKHTTNTSVNTTRQLTSQQTESGRPVARLPISLPGRLTLPAAVGVRLIICLYDIYIYI